MNEGGGKKHAQRQLNERVSVAAQPMRLKLRINVHGSLSYGGTLARLGSSRIGYVWLEEIIYSLVGIFLNELLHSLSLRVSTSDRNALVRGKLTAGMIGFSAASFT